MIISASSPGTSDEVEPNALNMTIEVGKHPLPAINSGLLGKCAGDELKVEAVAWHFAPPIVYDIKVVTVGSGDVVHSDDRNSDL
mmetsp:Transcript_4409/g.6758  ORF Transcript_4409/g.6758 Transcript_4409/m.6758 type:complete len:84 (+) Transcript_4409:42-293(+)